MLVSAVKGSSGGGTKCASGYYASSVPSTITTVDDTTGVAFEPKKISLVCEYNGSKTMACVYDATQSSTTYVRYYNNTRSTLPIPRTASNDGLDTVTSTGFTLYGNSVFTYCYYIAEG